MSEDPLRRLRHDIRGRVNALKLCVAALDTLDDPDEAAEFLDDIADVCDSTVQLMEELDQYLPEPPSNEP